MVLLDTDGTAAGRAARDLAAAAPERPVLYIISGGASAWLAQELPWKEPLKLSLNLDTLKAIDISGVAKGAALLRAACCGCPRAVFVLYSEGQCDAASSEIPGIGWFEPSYSFVAAIGTCRLDCMLCVALRWPRAACCGCPPGCVLKCCDPLCRR